jgi:hypothetical protein
MMIMRDRHIEHLDREIYRNGLIEVLSFGGKHPFIRFLSYTFFSFSFILLYYVSMKYASK